MFRKSLSKVISLVLSLTLTLVAFSSIPTANVSALTMAYTPSSGYKSSIYYQKLTEVELTGNQVTDIVNVAYSQLGYHEGNSTADYGGTNLSGNGNYTEYGRWIGVENVKWCATFVAWCAEQAGISTDIIAKQSWASGLDATSTVGHFGNAFKLFGTYSPKVGDLVYYNTHGDGEVLTSHVEIVSEVTDDYFVSIGGNSGNQVKTHKVPIDTGVLDSSFVTIGFESPNYLDTSVPPTNVDLTISNDYYTIDDYMVFNITADSATSMSITLTKDGQTVLNAPIYGTCQTTIRSLLNVTDELDTSKYGDYQIWLTATNASGSVDSKVSNFTVIDTPTYSNVKCWSSYSYSSTVSITVVDKYATGRTVYIEDSEGNVVLTSECGSTFEVPASTLGVGDFTVYFDIYNSLGTIQTDKTTFTICDTAPTYVNTSVDKTIYIVGEPIVVDLASDYALNFKVKAIKENGNLAYLSSTSDSTYAIQNLPAGKYKISVNAYNPVGSVDSKAIAIRVVDSSADVNGDGTINSMDILTLKKYLLNVDGTTKDVDINGDGVLNILDYVELKSILES